MKFPEWLAVFGDLDYRGACRPESNEQITFFAELERIYPELAQIALHPRNEGKRTPGQTTRQKMEGLNVGASDIIIPGQQTFVCELKRKNHRHSRWEPHQEGYLLACANNGAYVCVALGYEAALLAVENWITAIELERE